MHRMICALPGIIVLCGLTLLSGCGSGAGVGNPPPDTAPGVPAVPVAPRTLIVSKTPSATEFNSLEVAIREAHNGDTISVKPGTYNVPFALVKSVTIIGDGKREDIVLTSTTINSIVSSAAQATLLNLSVKYTGKTDRSTIAIRLGSLTLKDCDISSSGQSNGVQCMNGASVELDHCTVHNCGGVAVFIAGKGNVHDCNLSENSSWAVGSGPGADLTCKKNVMTKNKFGCVCVEESTADIEDNDLGGDGLDGAAKPSCVFVGKNGTAKIVHNTLHGDYNGVLLLHGGKATIDNNDIHHNENGIYGGDPGTNGTITGSKVYANGTSAIHFQDDSIFTTTKCDLFDNGAGHTDGVFSIALQASGTISNCKIHNNKTNGITTHHQGKCLIEDNDIYSNDMPGVMINTHGEATLRRNKVHNHEDVCGVVGDTSKITMVENEVSDNSNCGVRLRNQTQAVLSKNKINRNAPFGIEILNSSGGTFDDNDMRNNELGGWNVEPECKASVHRNRSIDDVTSLSRAKVGDWLEKKVVVHSAGGVKIETVILQIVKSITPDELTLDTTQTVNGVASQSVDTVPVSTKTDFVSSYVRKFPDAKVEVKNSGSATVDILDKPIKTTWTRYVITRDMNGKELKLDATVWVSPEIPLDEIAQVKCIAVGGERLSIDGSVSGYGDASKPHTPPAKPQPPAVSRSEKPAEKSTEKSAEKPVPPAALKPEPAPEKPPSKKPITVFKLKDGSTIRAVLAIESGDQVQIKDDAGKFHSVKKDDILEKTTE